MNEAEIAAHIVGLERASLERWGRGDPDGFLEITSPDVSYFDPFTERRLDGLAALRELYDTIRGKVHIDRFEILEPRVQVAGDVAILTFRFESHGSEGSMEHDRGVPPDGCRLADRPHPLGVSSAEAGGLTRAKAIGRSPRASPARSGEPRPVRSRGWSNRRPRDVTFVG